MPGPGQYPMIVQWAGKEKDKNNPKQKNYMEVTTRGISKSIYYWKLIIKILYKWWKLYILKTMSLSIWKKFQFLVHRVVKCLLKLNMLPLILLTKNFWMDSRLAQNNWLVQSQDLRVLVQSLHQGIWICYYSGGLLGWQLKGNRVAFFTQH